MFLRLDLNVEPIVTKELESYIKTILPEQLNEALFKDKNYLKKTIAECVKGQFRAILTEVLQDKHVKDILRDKVMQTLKLEEVE